MQVGAGLVREGDHVVEPTVAVSKCGQTAGFAWAVPVNWSR